ncbi:hypothetical protein BC827DRAFT_1145930 [Russula dissimulans]|nr:hypothetical protein BC827DRAFT_1145930 [Russula dissimulans]
MVLAHEDEEDDQHPYWYAKVMGISHVNARLSNKTKTRRVDFLWVHWFGRDPDHRGGFETRRLHRIGLMEPESPESYRFMDPGDVLRGIHLIPAFEIGKHATELMDDSDWEYFYISMFVDRDMFVRFLGGGIGHKVTEHIQQKVITTRHEYNDEMMGNSEGNNAIIQDTETETTSYQEQEDQNEEIEEVDANEELDFGYGADPEHEEEGASEREEDSDDEEDNYDEL